MNRRHFLLGCASGASIAAAAKPNIILVVRETSGLDTRRPGALRFSRAYAACPEDAGAQAALLTGMFPHAFESVRGTLHLGDVATLPSTLKEQGYDTVFAGDWKLAGRPTDHGFSHANAEVKAEPYFLLTNAEEPLLPGNPIVLLTAPHGAVAREPAENSVAVPLLVRDPRRAESTGSNELLVSHVDVAPTILGWCNAPPLEEAHGLNWERERREAVFAEGKRGEPDEWRMIVRGLDKLVVDKEGKVTHLYNLGLDPQEQDDQADLRAQRRRRDELMALLEEMKRKVRDGRTRSGLRRRG